MKSLIQQLEYNKIKIRWNKNPIRMDLFLSFLTVQTVRSTDNLGIYNGWTEYTNQSVKLIISGGIVGGINYLDSIQYGKNLSNPYNNFCSPFYLFDIMNDEGKDFFVDYYKPDIEKVINAEKAKITELSIKLENQKSHFKGILSFYDSIKKAL